MVRGKMKREMQGRARGRHEVFMKKGARLRNGQLYRDPGIEGFIRKVTIQQKRFIDLEEPESWLARVRRGFWLKGLRDSKE
jgi:hypothetical protein